VSQLPTMPASLEKMIADGRMLSVLKGTAGYTEYLSCLDELRALNYLDILYLSGTDAIMLAVAEARALFKVRQLVDERIAQGAALTAELDAAVEKLRKRQDAAQHTFSNRVDPRFQRTPAVG
jgi:hypothetical protein